MNDLGRTIAKLRERAGLSQKDLATKMCLHGAQITNQAVSKWENGTTQPSASQFLILCHILGISDILRTFASDEDHSPFSGLNAEGQKKAREYIDLLRSSKKYSLPAEDSPPQRTIPVYQLGAAGDSGHFLDSDAYRLVEVLDYVPIQANFGVQLSGDCMLPRFADGDIVWVHQQSQLCTGEIGIFLYHGQTFCRKISIVSGTISLLAINPLYPPIEVQDGSQFRILGKVLE